MTQFSASDAALEGFNLIRRNWRIVLGWAGFNLLALVMLVVLTVVLSLIAAAMNGGEASGPVAIVAGALVGVGTLVLQAIIAGGVFRLELRSQQPAFLHLRLGPDELRLVMVGLITLTGFWMIGWLAALLGATIHMAPLWIALVAIVAGVYLAVRFSLVAPISFAERRIDFPRSWRLTKGRVLALLGMNALSLSLIVLLMVVVLLALSLIAARAAGFDGLAGLFGGTEALQRHPGLYILEFAVEIILTPVLWILGVAPAIAAYRAFAAPPPEPA